ncbi:MAG: hypothetical protein JXM79_11840 [Sedimentisphaerales bacterium]|nr:hypothetical protein [Sedimentisphaerales bacterium]
MNKYNALSICLLLSVALGSVLFLRPQSSLGQDATAPDPNAVDGNEPPVTVERSTDVQNTWASYQIILQRNIFSRQRGPVRQRRAERPRPVITRNPESYHILKGIVQEDGTFIAFIENTQNSTVFRLREGEGVARGTVKNFTLDSIEYQQGDQTVSVALGRDLEGGQGTLSLNQLMELSASSSSVSDPNAAPKATVTSEEEAEILKKLMEQRQQQLGR